MAVFAIGFVFDNAENNADMEKNRRQKKFTGHLRILHPQRGARGTMQRFFQGCGQRGGRLQKVLHHF